MKTQKTENRKLTVAPDSTPGNHFKNNWSKLLLLILVLLHVLPSNAKTDSQDSRWQYSLSTGIHSFFAPIENLKWNNPSVTSSVGINRMMGQNQFFSLALQFQYAKNEYQGDATGIQILAQFLPVVLKKIELGFGTGAGYRMSFYPSESLKWNGTHWESGRKYKGMVQVPLQLSAGYRTIRIYSLGVIPFVAYQLQALLGYSPDLSPLPDSSFSIGFRFHFR